MIAFLKCVAEGFAENGLRGLARMVPGGEFVIGSAVLALQKYRQRRNDQAMRDDIQRLAQQSFEEAQRLAAEVAREVAGKAHADDRAHLEQLLAGIPEAIRQAMKRPEDPTGTTVAATYRLRTEEDLVKLLPARLPRLRPGAPLPRRPDWELQRQLGLGGFGEVWLAVHRRTRGLKLAVKFGRDTAADRDLVNERAVIERLMEAAPHPSLVPLRDASFDGDLPWLAYEYVDGGDLADLIRRWQGLPAAEHGRRATAAFRELAVAVAALHQRGIIHRDLKPSNILVESGTGRLRVTDFGISSVAARTELRGEIDGTTTRSGRLLSCLRGSYTPLYASPQQKDGTTPDPRDDVHALGVIGYQMFTGKLDRAPGVDLADDLAPAGAAKELIRAIGQCVCGEPKRRPGDAGAVLAGLDQSDAPVELMPVERRKAERVRPAPIPVASVVRPPVRRPRPAASPERKGGVRWGLFAVLFGAVAAVVAAVMLIDQSGGAAPKTKPTSSDKVGTYPGDHNGSKTADKGRYSDVKPPTPDKPTKTGTGGWDDKGKPAYEPYAPKK